MQVSRHIHITGSALKQWFVGQCYDSACVGLLWWAGLTFLQVPFALFWALLAMLFQFIPQFGPALSVIGPLIAAAFVGWETALYVLILYGVIVVLDGLLLQPLIMRRQTRVPIWASLMVPILLTLLLGFWGLLLAAPLLAIVFAYRGVAKNRNKAAFPRQTPPGQVITGGVLISPGEPMHLHPGRNEGHFDNVTHFVSHFSYAYHEPPSTARYSPSQGLA